MAVDTVFSKRRLLDVDPDYTDGHIIERKRRCLAEETGQEQAQQRVVELMVQELDNALVQKESEVLKLQERMQSCQRVLHVLRYGITSTYYKDFLSEAGPSSISIVGGQRHPAVLRLLGHPVTLLHGPQTRATCGKTVTEDGSDQEVVQESLEESVDALGVKCKDEWKREKVNGQDEDQEEEEKEENSEKQRERGQESVSPKVPRYVPPIMPDPPTICAASVRMERHRIKRRLVVGNISKWLPEDLRVGAATHKWMLYVRGPKDVPDISDFVSKVRYFLHPSYRPHDIAEVSHPFYLQRRGWGEFPVRVQVHFCLDGNRPIDIIHNLKLDRTYSGLQTLGGETVVDVWLKSFDHDISVKECNVETKQHESENELTSAVQTTVFSDGHHETLAHKELKVITEGHAKEVTKQNSTLQEEVKCSKMEHSETAYNFQTLLKAAKESGKMKWMSSAANGFVRHNLPDHDYLGPDTFNLKCLTCAEQYRPKNIHDEESHKMQMVHPHNGDLRHLQSTSGQPFSIPKTVNEQMQSLVQTIGHNPLNFETSLKVEKDEETASIVCEFREKTPVARNDFACSTSLVQCVDAHGNIFHITLQKPSLMANGDLAKDFSSKLDNSSDVSSKPHASVLDTNTDGCDGDSKIALAHKEILQPKMCSGSVASLNVGRSVLKKNCLTVSPILLSSPIPSELIKEHRPVGLTGRKLVLGRLHACSHKTKPAPDPAVQLRETAEFVSRGVDDCQFVTWLLRQLPLLDEQADTDPEFKKQHPYCAPSLDTFLSWPLGRRLSAERLRANAAHAILQFVDGPRFMKWSVRHILKWARMHALSLGVLGEVNRKHDEPTLHATMYSPVTRTISEPMEVRDWLESVSEASRAAEEMEEVDAEQLTASNTDVKKPACEEASKCPVLWSPSNAALCEFVRDTVEQLGIRVTADTVCPGVLYPAVEQLLFRAFQSLCEDLLRKSAQQAWNRCQQMPKEIILTDVQGALLTRCEFDVFTNAGLGVQAYNTPDYL